MYSFLLRVVFFFLNFKKEFQGLLSFALSSVPLFLNVAHLLLFDIYLHINDFFYVTWLWSHLFSLFKNLIFSEWDCKLGTVANVHTRQQEKIFKCGFFLNSIWFSLLRGHQEWSLYKKRNPDIFHNVCGTKPLLLGSKSQHPWSSEQFWMLLLN